MDQNTTIKKAWIINYKAALDAIAGCNNDEARYRYHMRLVDKAEDLLIAGLGELDAVDAIMDLVIEAA